MTNKNKISKNFIFYVLLALADGAITQLFMTFGILFILLYLNVPAIPALMLAIITAYPFSLIVYMALLPTNKKKGGAR